MTNERSKAGMNSKRRTQVTLTKGQLDARGSLWPRHCTQQSISFLSNDSLAADDFLLTQTQVIVGDCLQIVDVIKIDIFQEIHFWFDVAWNGESGQEQWPVA